MKRSGRPTEGFTVILSVIPPRTTPETRSDQIDGTANLTCKDGTCQHAIDGHEPTHNRSVAGSSASRPMRWAVDPSGRPALVSLRRCAARRPVGCPRNDPWPRSFY